MARKTFFLNMLIVLFQSVQFRGLNQFSVVAAAATETVAAS
jgi:hypothetical protein